jgi:hypothetical protein
MIFYLTFDLKGLVLTGNEKQRPSAAVFYVPECLVKIIIRNDNPIVAK